MEIEHIIGVIAGVAVGLLMLALSVLIFQGLSDNFVCKARTGLYQGCELKEREQKVNIEVK